MILEVTVLDSKIIKFTLQRTIMSWTSYGIHHFDDTRELDAAFETIEDIHVPQSYLKCRYDEEAKNLVGWSLSDKIISGYEEEKSSSEIKPDDFDFTIGASTARTIYDEWMREEWSDEDAWLFAQRAKSEVETRLNNADFQEDVDFNWKAFELGFDAYTDYFESESS